MLCIKYKQVFIFQYEYFLPMVYILSPNSKTLLEESTQSNMEKPKIMQQTKSEGESQRKRTFSTGELGQTPTTGITPRNWAKTRTKGEIIIHLID